MQNLRSTRWVPINRLWSSLLLALALATSCQRQDNSKAAPLSPQTLEAYAGRYQASPDTIVIVRRNGDHLAVEAGGQGAMDFFPQAEDRFLHNASPTQISFLRDNQGAVTDLILHRGGEHRAPRIAGGPAPDGFQTLTVGGIRYRLRVSGSGPTAVVLVSGLAKWAKVGTGIEPATRVIRFEAVEDASLPEKRVPQPVQEQVQTLHAFLEATQVAPPYVLVGHSFSGAVARLYADAFPEAVAGLVLVDPFQEGFVDWLETNQPKNYELFQLEAGKYASDWAGLLGALHKAQPPARLPVVLLTAGGREARTNDSLEQKLNREDFAAGARALLAAHQKWIGGVAKGKHIIVPEAGHEIPTEQPGIVVETIKQTLQQLNEAKR